MRDLHVEGNAEVRARLDAAGMPHVVPADPSTAREVELDEATRRALDALGYAGHD